MTTTSVPSARGQRPRRQPGHRPAARPGLHPGRAPGVSRARSWRRAVVDSMTERREAGMATAEYAIATIAAVGFAGLLILVLKSDTVRGMLTRLIESALSAG